MQTCTKRNKGNYIGDCGIIKTEEFKSGVDIDDFDAMGGSIIKKQKSGDYVRHKPVRQLAVIFTPPPVISGSRHTFHCIRQNIAYCRTQRCHATTGDCKLAFAASKFANPLKPFLALGFRRVAILVVLLQILALFGHVDDPRRGLYL
jgi:hypothetical protein